MADLVWNSAPLGDTDVDTYAVATSNGDGTFRSLGPGAVCTSEGYLRIPESSAGNKLPTSIKLISTQQNSISNALFVVNGYSALIYLPLVRR